ncbi:MAG: sulfite reductase subunit alpha [Pseudomonadota bacterium]
MTIRMPSEHLQRLGNALVLLTLAASAWLLFGLHDSGWPAGAPPRNRSLSALAVAFVYIGACAALLWRPRSRDDAASADDENASTVLVVHASQTGFARRLAEMSADSLRASGVAVRLCAIERLDAATLINAQRALFVASTTGEGDPPDPALRFVRDVMNSPPTRLDQLQYAVLALGDREYTHFCAFGHALDEWLRGRGAQPIFDLVEVDNADDSALRHWQHGLGQLAGVTDLPDWTPPHYDAWRLEERTLLNPDSLGGSAFHLALRPMTAALPEWKAGDIAEIGPCHSASAVTAWLSEHNLDGGFTLSGDHNDEPQTFAARLARSQWPSPEEIAGLAAADIAARLKPLPHREYSIASIPADGRLQLLVRRMSRPDGTPGLGSGWLCESAAPGDRIQLRIRSNPGFHPPAAERPLILIGNGTGIAGLRAHLRVRIETGARRNWLLFGERQQAKDFFYGDEIRGWQRDGWLARLDLAFSRDPSKSQYVQDLLHDAEDDLRAWADEGACLLVCGSLAGMAPGVDAALRSNLGDAQVERMRVEGRYRRDIY